MRRRRTSRRSKSLSEVAASTMGLSQRLSRAVMVCLIPEKVLSEAEVKSWIADTQAWLRRWPTLRAS
jgi:hypothetical protein